MENAEVDIQLDAHPGPPCASRFSDGAYVPLGPAQSEYRIWCTVMMTTPTRIEGGARHPDWCRPLLAGPHSAIAQKTLVPFRSAPPTSFDGCTSRQATEEGRAHEQLHAPGCGGGYPQRGLGAPAGQLGWPGSWARREWSAPLWITRAGFCPAHRSAAHSASNSLQAKPPPARKFVASVPRPLTAALIEG